MFIFSNSKTDGGFTHTLSFLKSCFARRVRHIDKKDKKTVDPSRNLVSGFSLIEIIVAIAMLLIVAGITLYSFSSLNDTNALEVSVAGAVSNLSEARSKTLASIGSNQYGVHIDSDETVLFVGSTYSSTDPNNVTVSLNKVVEIANISLNGGGSDIVFDRLTGQTSEHGSFIVRLKDNTNASSTITIFQTGIIETS